MNEVLIKQITNKVMNQIRNYGKQPIFNLNNITNNKLKESYVNYKLTHCVPTFDSVLFYFNEKEKKNLKESVNKPLSLSEVKKEIIKKYNLQDWQFIIKKHANDIEIALCIPEIEKNTQMIEDDMNIMGYFLSHYYNEHRDNGMVF